MLAQVRFQAITTMEDLFQMRDAHLHSPIVDILRAEENQEQERRERWEKAVAPYKNKPPTISRKGGTSTLSATSPPTQTKSTKEHTSAKEGIEGLEERPKMQRTDDVNLLILAAMTFVAI